MLQLPVMGEVAQAEMRTAPAGQGWTADGVGVALIAAFRSLPHLSVYSPGVDVLEPADPGEPLAGVRLVNAAMDALGRRSVPCIMLLTWARARAVGASIPDVCRERGWARATFYREVREALTMLAAGLNHASSRAA